MPKPEEHEYFFNKKQDKTYVSKSIKDSLSDAGWSPIRIISKIFEPDEDHTFAKMKDEIVLRVTSGGRQEVKAKFYEDTRHIFSLTIQRFTRESGNPHKQSFTFRGKEIEKLLDFIKLIKHVHLDDDQKVKLDENDSESILATENDKRRLIRENPELVTEIIQNDLTTHDVVALGYRKKQLDIFYKLLYDDVFLSSKQEDWNIRGREGVWQHFFESNRWIFGYGLNYIFTDGLDGKKLEQYTTGYSVRERGKRVDALLKTRGYISSLCFVEIKHHETSLIKGDSSYRSGAWQVSKELSGSVTQCQSTVQKALESIKTKLEPKDDLGNPTGELAYLYNPKSYLIIGCLEEFQHDRGINEEKFRSFELYRRNIINPEIITFDELYERAKHIVHHSGGDIEARATPTEDDGTLALDDDLPF